MFHLTFELYEDAYLWMNRCIFRKVPEVQKQKKSVRGLFFWLIAYCAFMSALFLLTIKTAPRTMGVGVAVNVVILIVVIIALFGVSREAKNLPETVHKMCESGEYLCGETMEYSFEDEFFRCVDSRGEERHRYSILKQIYSDENYLYIRKESLMAFYIIPFTAFRDAEEKNAFLQFLSEKTGVQIQ